jgi:hypothetical protein
MERLSTAVDSVRLYVDYGVDGFDTQKIIVVRSSLKVVVVWNLWNSLE